MVHTLLLADDSVTIQRVIELTFAEEDVQVVAVSDGDQAIERLESAPPDIVLADIGMPGRNGYEVARYIRQSPKLAHIPVVLLTGAFEPVDQVKAAEVGCDGVLAKPFEPQLVIGRVKELLTSTARKAQASFDASLAPPRSPGVDQPAPPPVDPSLGEQPASEAAASDLDSYFDRLDSAFANLSNVTPATKSPEPTFAPPESTTAAPAAAVADQIDWFAQQPPAPSADADLPMHGVSDAAPVADPAPGRIAPAPPPAQSVQAALVPAPAPPAVAPPASVPVPAPVARRDLPTIAEAFAAILDAEQHDTGSTWPVASSPQKTDISPDVIDQITQRVLAQLSDRVVREAVGPIAERLVREEIQRIKDAIQ